MRFVTGGFVGYGDPARLVAARASTHPVRLSGFGAAVIDRVAYGAVGRAAIRGREQQLIDSFGGVGNPRVANLIRGVARANPAGRIYHSAANSQFGQIAPFTGY